MVATSASAVIRLYFLNRYSWIEESRGIGAGNWGEEAV